MRRRFLIVAGLIIAAAGTSRLVAEEATPLRIVASSGTISASDFVVRGERILSGRSSGTLPLPPDTRWSLEGDFHGNSRFILLNPEYRLTRIPAFGAEPPQGSAVCATVFVNRDTAWTDAELRGGIVLFAWAVNQRPVAVEPVVAQIHEQWPGCFAAIAAWELGPGEETGVPWVLLWKNGRFIPPRETFHERSANVALTELHFGSAASFRHAASQPKVMDARSRNQRFTLLHYASEVGNTAAIDALIAAGAVPHATSQAAVTALQLAAEKGRAAVIPQLLAAGATTTQRTAHGWTPARAALTLGHLDAATTLNQDLDPAELVELARRAAFHGDRTTIRALIDKGQTSAFGKLSGGTLARAIELRDPELLATLIETGVAPAEEDRVPLIVQAAAKSDPIYVRVLADAHVPLQATTEDGLTALMVAASLGNHETVKTLLERGADPNPADRLGRTSLHHAVLSGNPQIVATLIPVCALAAKDVSGRSALDYALGMHSPALIDPLLGAGAMLDPASPTFGPSVEHAIALDRLDVLRSASGSDWKAATLVRETWTVQDVARHCNARNILAFLAAAGSETALKTDAKPDQPPKLLRGEKPPDIRAAATAPAAAIEVLGIVDVNGRFIFPQITGSSDAQLSYSVLRTVATYDMQPATKDGRPVAARTKLVFKYPARDPTIYTDEISQPAVVISSVRPEPSVKVTERIDQRATRWTFRTVVDSTGRVTRMSVPIHQPPERRPVAERVPGWAAATIVVETDGQPGIVQIADASDPTFAEAAEKALHAYRFSPAQNGKGPVRSRLTLVVTAIPD